MDAQLVVSGVWELGSLRQVKFAPEQKKKKKKILLILSIMIFAPEQKS